MPNPSNIVSRLLLSSTSPVDHPEVSDDAPLDLSLKPSSDLSVDADINQIDEEDEEEVEQENARRQYLCSVCPYKHSSWSSVQRHLSLHVTGQGLVCPLCSYTGSSEDALVRHLTLVHPTSHLPSTFPAACPTPSAHIIEQHRCSHCSYQCDRAEALDLHSRLEHGADELEDEEEYDIDSSDGEEEEEEEEEEGLATTSTKNLFECPLCSPSSLSTESTTLEELTMHVITHHHNQSCPFCSFTTNTNSSPTLIPHVKLHFNGTLIPPDPLLALDQVKELLMLE